MIKEELRIGNLVYFNPNGRPFVQKIIELRTQDLVCNCEARETQRLALFYDDCHLEPIPLTHEILEGCGFIKSNEFDIWYFDKNDTAIDIEKTKYGQWLFTIDDRGDNEGTKPRAIFSLHELQNLYYAISGSELTVNFPSLSEK